MIGDLATALAEPAPEEREDVGDLGGLAEHDEDVDVALWSNRPESLLGEDGDDVALDDGDQDGKADGGEEFEAERTRTMKLGAVRRGWV